MLCDIWEDHRLKSSDEDFAWELFHEDSKTGRYDTFPPQAVIFQQMQQMTESFRYEGFPRIDLPTELDPALNRPLGETLLNRKSARHMRRCELTLSKLATLLHCAYGITRRDPGEEFPRPFRVVPSGGALYPLEIYFHSCDVVDLNPGLFHYNPVENCLRHLQQTDLSRSLSDALVPFQSELAFNSAGFIFITALFKRSTFKYGPRGYRFVLLEAGHVAQNINLVATAMNLGVLNVGGFFDRSVDKLLKLDGVAHATIYMIALGADRDSA